MTAPGFLLFVVFMGVVMERYEQTCLIFTIALILTAPQPRFIGACCADP